MSTGDIIGTAAAAIAVIGIIATVIYGRLALNPPKRALAWSYSATPLFSRDQLSWRDAIEIRVGDRHLRDPYLVMLRLENNGRQDITSGMFDQKRPLHFSIIGTKVATVYEDVNDKDFIRADGNHIFIGPELLRSGQAWTVRCIADGKPEVRLLSSYLVGADVHFSAKHSDPGLTLGKRALAPVAATSVSTILALIVTLVSTFVMK